MAYLTKPNNLVVLFYFYFYVNHENMMFVIYIYFSNLIFKIF